MTSVEPVIVAVIDLITVLACLVAAGFVLRGWKRSGLAREIPILFMLLIGLMGLYGGALFLEWSGLMEKINWHFMEDFGGVFIPFLWAFAFYVVDKSMVVKDLEVSRTQFRNLVESTSDWIWEVDTQGRYTYVSTRVRRVLGYTPEELLGKTPFDLMPPDEAERTSKMFAGFVENKTSFQHLENLNLHKDGHEVYLETNGTPIFDDNGKLIGYHGVDRDITERKKAEQLTARRQAEMDSIFTASPVGIALIRDRKMIRGNERFLEIAGYGSHDIQEIDVRVLYLSQTDYDAVGRKYEQARKEGRAAIETRWVRADNVIIDVVEYFAPLDPDDPDKGYSVIVQDITELKAARKEAEAEKSKAQLYLDAANVIILVLDTRGYVNLVNKKCCEILGRSAEQIEGVDWFQTFLPTSYQPIARHLFNRMMAGDGKAGEYFENPVCTPDGTEKLIAWRNTILRDESGSMTGVICSGLDITAERAAENALRDSDQQLRMALSAAKMGTWRWKPQTNRIIRSANLNALLGLPAEESTQTVKDFFDIVHPDDRTAAREEFEKAVHQQSAYTAQFRIVRPDGQIHWMLDQGKPFFDFNGKLDYMTGVLVDVTDLKKTEQGLQESEARFQAVADYTYDWETWVDRSGKIQWINPAVERITGYSVDECLNMEDYPLPLVDEQDRKRVAAIMKEALAGSSGNDEQFRIRRKDGDIGWGDISWQPIYDKQGQSLGFRSSVRDIGERVKTQKALRFTQFAVDHAHEDAYWVDSDGRFFYVNERACETLEYTREELLALRVPDINPDFPEDIWADEWDKLRDQKALRFESHHKTKDGRVYPVEISANFVTYHGREYACVFARDISERKAAEQEREVLMEQLRQRNDEMQSIVFTAAHDLRSPLVNIAGFTGELEKGLRRLEQLLKDASLDKQVEDRIEHLLKTDIAESLGFVRFGSQHMDMLLNGLMRLSVIGAAPIEFSEVDTKDLLNRIIEGLRYRINENAIEISVPDELPNCFGDFAMLTQVFSNLIDNAIKYRHPERAAIIEIGATIQDDTVEYTVADNGIGIESAHLEKVFELFHRLHPKQEQDGQGLGLTIVRRILYRLGGTVRIDSVPDLGTTVYIRLPRA